MKSVYTVCTSCDGKNYFPYKSYATKKSAVDYGNRLMSENSFIKGIQVRMTPFMYCNDALIEIIYEKKVEV